MLDRARTLLGPDVPLVLATLPELGVEGTFDAAVCTFDGLNYLGPGELAPTFAALAERLRPEGWLVFDVHTDAMMDFTVGQPVVTGEADGSRFRIASDVDRAARSCVTTIELEPPDGIPFEEEHRQWFHADADIRAALGDAGFAVAAVQDEYTAAPADGSSLRATWIARRS
jgi:SAM-dependent methyltransferase